MTCTVTMPTEVAKPGIVNADDLLKADYQFTTPFLLDLVTDELYAERVLRLVPGKRMVVFGTWRGMKIVAKLFFDKRRAKQQATADAKGIQLLEEHKIPTPTLQFSGTSEDNRIHALIFERIQDGHDLYELWTERQSDQDMLPILHAVMIELATQHVLGVQQKDMHLGNYLIAGKIIYTIDGSDVTASGRLLSKVESMNNLALLLSQMGVGITALQESLFLHYARARGWLIKPTDTLDLKFLIKQNDLSRWQEYQKKIFRSSTDFLPYQRLGQRGMLLRAANKPEMQAFLKDPDSVFAKSDVQMLKKGRSSTVIKVTIDGREVVVKRYNMKNAWHRLRRMFRQTRAEHCWRLAHKLCLFQVKTAAPVAYVESNWFGLRGKSYYVMDYVPGVDIKTYFMPFETEPYRAATLIQSVCQLLASLQQLEITHGDLKATNMIVNHKQQPVLIDLDGANEHLTLSGLHHAWRDEMQRFLRNFDDMPALLQIMQRLLLQGQR